MKRLSQYLKNVDTGWPTRTLHDQIVNLSVMLDNLNHELAEILQESETLEEKLRHQGTQDAADDAVKLIDSLYIIADYLLKAEQEADKTLADYLG